MATAKDFAAIFFIVLFGGLFVFICIVSAIKAVRDRKKIKKFIKAKEEALKAVRLKRQAYVNMGQIEESPKRFQSITFEENKESIESLSNKGTRVLNDKTDKQNSPTITLANNNRSPIKYQGTSSSQNDGNSSRNSVYSIDTSLRHIASMESLTDDVMKTIEKRDDPIRQQTRSLQEHGNIQRSPDPSGSSSSPGSANLTLPEDYVTATKTLRRYSYQVACRAPEIDRAAPIFAKSEVIIKTYRSNNVAFENVAFNCDRNP